MYKIAAIFLCVILFTGCNKTPETAADPAPQINEVDHTQQQKQNLLQEFSGVWSDHHDLLTLYYDGTAVHLIIDDEAKEVSLGDIDLQNETINLLVTKIEDEQQGIITLRRVWNDAKTEFTLNFTGFDGTNVPLGFVRKIGHDDKTRIENIYTNQINDLHEGEDPSTPAYDVSTGEDYSVQHHDAEDVIAAANNAAMATYEAEMATQAAADAENQAAYEATQAAYEAVEVASEVNE